MLDHQPTPDPFALDPFPYETVGGVTCEVLRPAGEVRQNVVALHGILSHSSSYRGYMRPFAERGYAVYAVNYPFHGPGYCPKRVGDVRAADCVDAARRVLRELGSGIVLGKSFGGLVAQALTHEPEVRGTVLLASSPPPGVNYTPGIHKALPILYSLGARTLWQLCTGRTFRYSFGFCRRYVFNGAASDEQARGWHGEQAESVWLVWDQIRYRVPVYVDRRHAPMLVCAGTEDPGLPVWVQKKIARLWGAQYREFAGHSHMLTCEPGWERVCEQLLDWLDANTRPLASGAASEPPAAGSVASAVPPGAAASA